MKFADERRKEGETVAHDQKSSRRKVETRRRDEKSTPPPSENLRAYISVPLFVFFFAAFLPLLEPLWPYTFARVSSVSGVPISQLVEMRSQPQINDPLPVTRWHVSVNPSSAWPVYLRYIYNIFNAAHSLGKSSFL